MTTMSSTAPTAPPGAKAPARAKVRPWYAHTLTSASGIGSLLVVGAILVIAVVAPIVWGDAAADVNAQDSRLSPSLDHPFGTDELGRDVLLRVLVGTRTTLVYTAGAVVISTLLGVALGLLAASLGHRARQVMFQISATATAFPAILLAVLLATLFGRSGGAAMLGLAIAGAPQVARLTMNLATSAAGSDDVNAARTVGVRGPRLLVRYILPQVAEPLATLTIMTAASYLIALSALSFVGLGVQPPEWDWGYMLSGALLNIYQTPAAVIGPGIAVVVTGIAFNVLGESLATGIDPRNRVSRRRRATKPTRRRLVEAPLADARTQDDASARTTGEAVSSSDVATPDELLSVRDLTVTTADGQLELVHGVTLSVGRGERVGIVGESGSGKSLAMAALAELLPGGVTASSASHRAFGEELRGLPPRAVARILGQRLAFVFQDPMGSLNPAMRVGSIMSDRLAEHLRKDKKAARKALVEALERVGIPEPAEKLRRHPHELSGGQRQRVMLAMALLGDTEVLLADEPTTALDVSVQAEILKLLRDLCSTKRMTLILVSHDLAVVSRLCDRMVVMHDGRIVEEGPTERVLTAPQHSYTRFLLSAAAPCGPALEAGSGVRATDASFALASGDQA